VQGKRGTETSERARWYEVEMNAWQGWCKVNEIDECTEHEKPRTT